MTSVRMEGMSPEGDSRDESNDTKDCDMELEKSWEISLLEDTWA